MGTRRSIRDATDDFYVLLVGPDQWQERVRPKIAGAEAVSVRTARSKARAMTETTTRPAVDCILCASRVEDGTGLELFEAVRSRDVSTPFVLAPSDGSESLAAEAIDRGVTDYVPVDDDSIDLERRCRQAGRRRRETQRRREKADQFEAFFSTPNRFVSILDTDGTVVRTNHAARQYLGASDEENGVVGKRFWGLPWTDDGNGREFQQAIRRARGGEYAGFEATLADAENETRFEFVVRPVEGASSEAPKRLLVEGREVTERIRLQTELRESEELHRVTLNNMTDTVLVTDDDGEFTYVCPNVHFIFGYSAEEIYDLGSIDALLGADLFDRNRLESEDVLTNVECTATDKSGQEHTLLVNVRNVSIQGGTTLYSCRDITKRKQRERALTQLHQTSRDLLYAETNGEIADHVVTDSESILPTAAAAVYRFDREENVLFPTAVSDELGELLGTLPELRLDRETIVGQAFVDDETRTFGCDPESASRQSALSSLGDYIAVPLSDHGVFLAADSAEGVFDEVSEEVAELLAATTEAAFDRVERESQLKERDRTLQRQNRRLSQLNRVNEFIREIDQALVGAETRESIETSVCERLTADDRFSFAWVGETTSLSRDLRPRTWAGDERGYLDSVPLAFDADDESIEPSVRVADDREAVLVSNVADHLRTGQWCREAVSREFQSVLSIPLVYDDVLFGTLSVYAKRPDAFDEMVRSVLCELGDTVASAINAVQRKQALQSDTVVELEYEITDTSAVLSRLAAETGATMTVEGEVTKDDETTLVFATVENAGPGQVVEVADEFYGITDTESIREGEESGLVGLRLRDGFISTVLADHGAVLERLRAAPSGTSLTVNVPSSVTTRSVDEVVSNAYDAAQPVAQREQTRALEPESRRGRFLGDLTERQREVAQVAYHVGFFDSKRDVTGTDVASMLDISDTAFYDHVRRIERKLFATLFENTPHSPMVE